MTIADKPLSIEVFLVDCDPEGMLTVTIPFQWTEHILVFKRPQLEKALAREEAEQPGFYILISEDGEEKILYTCQSQEFMEQGQAIDWWTTAIFITNKGYLLQRDHIDYLEEQIIKKAVKASNIFTLPQSNLSFQDKNDQSTKLSEGHDHAPYIQSWLKVLKEDKRAIFSAASHAQRAVDYIKGFSKAPAEIE